MGYEALLGPQGGKRSRDGPEGGAHVGPILKNPCAQVGGLGLRRQPACLCTRPAQGGHASTRLGVEWRKLLIANL